MEATASFSTAVDELEYQPAMPAAPDPETLVSVPQHGEWASSDWFERRNVAIGEAAAGTRLWLRPNGNTPADPILASCLLTYLSAVTLFEPALTPRRKTATAHSNSAMRDHSVFFHRPPELSDWLLYDQSSPSGIGGRALATGIMFNRNGELVCTATQEIYFRPPRR